MKSQNEENLKELFERFLDSEEAEQAVEDIREGERILRENPVPEPDKELVAGIKTETAKAVLLRKKNVFRRIIYEAAAVAAAVVILAAISIVLFEKDSGEPERVAAVSGIPAAIWESERLADDDADLASLAAEIEQIESDLLAVQLGENGDNGSGAAAELELELIEINNDFWKG
jgi:hypothetical protein